MLDEFFWYLNSSPFYFFYIALKDLCITLMINTHFYYDLDVW